MRRLQNMSVRQRLIWLVLVASLLALICVIGAVSAYEINTFLPSAQDQLESEAVILQEALRATLEFHDSDTARRYLETRRAIPELAAAALYGKDGQVFAEYHRPDVNILTLPTIPAPAGAYFTPRQLTLWQPVRKDGELLGHLVLIRDLPPWYRRLPQYFIMFVAVSGALVLVGVTIQLGANRHFLRPLVSLVNTTSQVIQRNDYTVRAEVRRDDELGRLAQAFNQMLEVIGQRDVALRQAGAQIQKVFDATTQVAIIATDLQGIVTVFNTGAERMLGYRAEDVVGKLTPAAWHVAGEIETRGAELARTYGRALHGFDVFVEATRRGQSEAREWTFVRKDGSQLKVYLAITALRDASNAISGFLGMANDVTERIRAEAELRRSEERFRSLIENASDMITVINSSGIIRFQSPSSERVLGYAPDTLVGKSIFELIHPEDQTTGQDAWRRALDNPGLAVSIETRLRHQNDQWRTIEAVGRSVPEESAEGYLILNARDVTESRKMAEQFRQSQKMEAIGQLCGGVAHDFHNILSIIQGNISLMRLQDELSAEMKDSITEVGEAATRAANLTRQLLAFSRRQTIQRKELDLNEVVSNLTRMLQRIVGEDVRIQTSCSPHPARISADAGMMEQILMNLVVNARDAMPRGGKLVIETAKAEFDETIVEQTAQARPGKFISLSVTDSGCGIPPETLPKIFEPFFTTEEVGKGTGLGLATVYGIVRQHEGWVSVYSEVGLGTTFRVYLPYQSEATEVRPSAPVAARAQSGNETILVVEDEPQLRTLVRRILSRQGYKILEASTARAALDVWKQHAGEIRLLLTDLVMPDGMSGMELAHMLLNEQPSLKVIYTSGYSPEIAGKDVPLQDGINFLAKPFDSHQLSRVVRTSLDG